VHGLKDAVAARLKREVNVLAKVGNFGEAGDEIILEADGEGR
jgi:hypothetical protein